ncbi:ABC transporter permease [Georgenia sp. Z1491]|uniref:ABC transporter permease n=1 Tax=Georgenia sp. Z1491 TaxID=3416707 RepID=UPI003CEB8E65
MTTPNPSEVPDESRSSREENELELRDVAGLTQGQIVRRRFFRHVGAMASLVYLALVTILAFTSVGFFGIDGWWRWGARDRNPEGNVNELGAPTLEVLPESGGLVSFGPHPFGQNEIAQDLFAQVMYGIQTSLLVMAIIGVIAAVIGVLVGALAGFFRGWLDNLLMRMTDLVITVPTVVLGAVLGTLLGNPHTMDNIYGIPLFGTVLGWMSFPVLFAIVLGLVLWTGMARLVRGDFLALREREFVDAARVAGASNARIIFKHILPNAIGVVIVNATLLMASAVLLETALAYLGFGILPPDYSLGWIISEYQGAFATRPWAFWWPGFFIITIALSINFIGDGLRDAFDPRQRRKPSAGAMRRAAQKSQARKDEQVGATSGGAAAGVTATGGTGSAGTGTGEQA